MNILKEMELAIWKLAEAQTHERKARRLRYEAALEISAVYAEMKEAIEKSKEKKERPTSEVP
jgi:hypothetical protein